MSCSRRLRVSRSQVALAAVNGPSSVVVSGDQDAVLDVARVWRERGVNSKRLRVSHAFHSPRMDGMLDEFGEVARGLSFSPPRIPIVSNLTGELVSEEQICSAEYWVRHVREPVRFMDGIRWLEAHGVRSFLELGPDGVLTAMARSCLVEHDAQGSGGVDVDRAVGSSDAGGLSPTVAVPLMRGERPETKTLISALGEVWVRGVGVDWEAIFADSGAKRVGLPTYAFQRERYWLGASGLGMGDASSIGMVSADHPMLGAAVGLADDRGWLFTGRFSLETHPWLADHAVMGAILLPGTAFLEMALHAGGQLGCEHLPELTLEAPLVLPEQGAVVLQVAVGELDESGQRVVSIHSHPQQGVSDVPGQEHQWTSHASGVLSVGGASLREQSAVGRHLSILAGGVWPPVDAVEVAVGDFYDRLGWVGVGLWASFQGLTAAWRRGDEIFAEVVLPAQEREWAGRSGVHPALFDAALHAAGLLALNRDGDGSEGADGGVPLPFSWREVSVAAVGASSLRVYLASAGDDAISLLLADETGQLVASVQSLSLRAVSAEQIGSVRGEHHESMFCVDWAPVPVTFAPLASAGGLVLLDAGESLGAELGAERGGLVEGLRQAGALDGAEVYADLLSLGEAVGAGVRVPEVVLVDLGAGGSWEELPICLGWRMRG